MKPHSELFPVFPWDKPPEEEFRTGGKNVWGKHKGHQHTETYTGIRSGIPYLMTRFPKRREPSTPFKSYPLFADRVSGDIRWFAINHQKNPHVMVVGSTRKSGKSTLIDVFIRHEMLLGAFSLIIDPKGQYPYLPYHMLRVKEMGLQDAANPVLLKPSKLSRKDWQLLLNTYTGEGKSVVERTVMKTIRELTAKGSPLTLDAIIGYIDNGNIKSIKTGGGKHLTIQLFFDDLRASGLFSEEEGIDMLEIMRNFDCLILDTKSPDEEMHVPLLAQHIIRNICELKIDSDPNKGRFKKELKDIWDRRVIVVLEEAADPDIGLICRDNVLSSRGVIEKLFTFFAYANIIGVIITQNPQNISTRVINSCSNLWLGHMFEPNAIKKIAGMTQMAPTTVLKYLQPQRVGEFLWVVGDDNRRVSVVLPDDWEARK